MEFKNVLNEYIKLLKCSAQELANYSHISPSIISRYRSGERIPKINSKQLRQLINAIYNIAVIKEIKSITKESVHSSFLSVLENNNYDYTILKNNLNSIVTLIKINLTELSRYLGYDPSYLSKIRSGSRKPAHTNQFIDGICHYIMKKEDYTDAICTLINMDKNEAKDPSIYYFRFKKWLCNNQSANINYIDDFFKYIDDFNLNEYITTIHFDDLKIPYIPFQLPKSKNYYGLEEMKQAELDFFKATVLSRNKNDIFMCSDMQMDDMATDIEFGKKWMFAIAMCLKKGLHLNIIHDINRPFNEMMLGLESWIPIYMTGQVSPFYLKNYQNKVYSHLNYTSGEYSLYGECLKGYHSDGKYYLTSNKKENDYYQEKTKQLLKIAHPLMEIYREESKDAFKNFINIDSTISGERRRILSSLPLHTMSEKLLTKILKLNDIPNDKIEMIKEYQKAEKENINNIINNNRFIDEIHILSKKNVNSNDILINPGSSFYDLKIKYTYETYIEHYNETISYEKKNKNYILINNNNLSFKNIDIYINSNNYVVISKKRNPNIQFVIKHPKLINAIENFIPPVIEK